MNAYLSILFVAISTLSSFGQIDSESINEIIENCPSYITKEHDKFEGETRFLTPFFYKDSAGCIFHFQKRVKNKATKYHLVVRLQGPSLPSTFTTVIILLQDGSKIIRRDHPVIVDDKLSTPETYHYGLVLELTKQEVTAFLKEPIDAFRVLGEDYSLRTQYKMESMVYFYCLYNAK